MPTPFERLHQAHMALKAARQEAADAVAALKQQFGSCEISVNVHGKSIEIMLAPVDHERRRPHHATCTTVSSPGCDLDGAGRPW